MKSQDHNRTKSRRGRGERPGLTAAINASLNDPHNAPLMARGKVKLARAMGILLRAHPFHGHIAAGWRARPDTSTDTMGVCWSCGSVQLLWNPEFVDRISDMELAGVLTHEVNHVVLRHPFLFSEQVARSPEFDAIAALVAEEVTVNEFVALPLPGSPLLLADFVKQCPALEPLQATRDRYRLLYDPARARRHHEARQKFEQTLEDIMRELLGKGASPSDSHAGWESFKNGGAAAALAVSVATARALERHGHTLSPELRQLIHSAHGGLDGSPGTTPGGMLETLAGTARARLSWQNILRRLLAVGHNVEPTYQRPPRRFPELAGVLPGSRRVPARLRILAAIDTSGSMSSATLDEIAAELRVMARSYDVSVVEFDAEIQRKYRLSQQLGQQLSQQLAGSCLASVMPGGPADPLLQMRGRGGTNFCPVFERGTLDWAADGEELSGVVVFTDGYGPAPQRGPREHVIWVLIGSGVRQPAPWGTVVNPGAAGAAVPTKR